MVNHLVEGLEPKIPLAPMDFAEAPPQVGMRKPNCRKLHWSPLEKSLENTIFLEICERLKAEGGQWRDPLTDLLEDSEEVKENGTLQNRMTRRQTYKVSEDEMKKLMNQPSGSFLERLFWAGDPFWVEQIFPAPVSKNLKKSTSTPYDYNDNKTEDKKPISYLMDSKASQKIAIALTTIRMDPKVLCEYLNILDTENLSIDLLEALVKSLLTPENVGILKRAKLNNELYRLRDVEKMLIPFIEIPHVYDRCRLLLIARTIMAELEILSSTLDILKKGGEEILQSKQLKAIFEGILLFGNQINNGSNSIHNLVTKGIMLEKINRIWEFRSSKDSNITGLHFVVANIIASDPKVEIWKLATSLPSIPNAAQVQSSTLNTTLRTTFADIDFAEKTLITLLEEGSLLPSSNGHIKSAQQTPQIDKSTTIQPEATDLSCPGIGVALNYIQTTSSAQSGKGKIEQVPRAGVNRTQSETDTPERKTFVTKTHPLFAKFQLARAQLTEAVVNSMVSVNGASIYLGVSDVKISAREITLPRGFERFEDLFEPLSKLLVALKSVLGDIEAKPSKFAAIAYDGSNGCVEQYAAGMKANKPPTYRDAAEAKAAKQNGGDSTLQVLKDNLNEKHDKFKDMINNQNRVNFRSVLKSAKNNDKKSEEKTENFEEKNSSHNLESPCSDQNNLEHSETGELRQKLAREKRKIKKDKLKAEREKLKQKRIQDMQEERSSIFTKIKDYISKTFTKS